MSVVLVAIIVTAIAVAAGVGSADITSRVSYKLFGAQRGGEKYILQTLGGVVGFAIGIGSVTTGNLFAGLYGPPLAVIWITAVFVAIIGVGKLFFSIFR